MLKIVFPARENELLKLVWRHPSSFKVDCRIELIFSFTAPKLFTAQLVLDG